MSNMPSVSDASAFAQGLDACADCYSDRVIVVLAAEVDRLARQSAESAMAFEVLRREYSQIKSRADAWRTCADGLAARIERRLAEDDFGTPEDDDDRGALAEHSRLASAEPSALATPTREEWRDCCRDIVEKYNALHGVEKGLFGDGKLDEFRRLDAKEKGVTCFVTGAWIEGEGGTP